MARRPKIEKSEWAVLTPRQLPDGKWRVSLGVSWENGKRKNPRRIFSNNADALQFCRDEEARRKAHGQITANADGVKVAAWLELEDKLLKAGAGSLKEVGERVLRDTLAITVVSTAGECLSRYLSHRGKSVYADDSRNRCNHFIRWFGAEGPIREATRSLCFVAELQSLQLGNSRPFGRCLPRNIILGGMWSTVVANRIPPQ